jgi:hypothetical protein
MKRLFIVLACLLAFTTLHGQTVYWFNASNGDTACRANTLTAPTLSFQYHCQNPRGSTTGSYTAIGNTTTDTLTFGINTVSGGGTLCTIAINTTPAAVGFGSFGMVPSGAVTWQCAPAVLVTGTTTTP